MRLAAAAGLDVASVEPRTVRGRNFLLVARHDRRVDDNGPRLAPLYDLLSTIVYPELSPGLAMKIGGSSTLDEINAGAWAAFALEAAIGLPLIRRRVAEISEAVKDQAESVATELIHAGLDGTFLARIAGWPWTGRDAAGSRSARAPDSRDRTRYGAHFANVTWPVACL